MREIDTEIQNTKTSDGTNSDQTKSSTWRAPLNFREWTTIAVSITMVILVISVAAFLIGAIESRVENLTSRINTTDQRMERLEVEVNDNSDRVSRISGYIEGYFDGYSDAEFDEQNE